MKRTVFVSATVFLLLFSLISCGSLLKPDPIYRFEATYSERHTAAYFMHQYVHADPNLVHVYAAVNEADTYKYSGKEQKYYAIKGVSIDEYVCYSEDYLLMDPGFSAAIIRNTNMDTKPEILTLEVSGAELFWANGYCYMNNTTKKAMEALGKNIFYYKLEDVDAAALQKSLKENIEAQNYIHQDDTDPAYFRKKFKAAEHTYSYLTLKIRVHFQEYENIVWDAAVVKLPGKQDTYYVEYCLACVDEDQQDFDYDIVYIPLDDVIGDAVSTVSYDKLD